MLQRIIIRFLLLLGSLPLVLQGQSFDSLRLDQLQTLARQQAIEVQLAERDRQFAQADFELYQASLRPGLDLTANLPNYSRSAQETTQPDGTISFQSVRINNSFAGLEFSQRLGATGGFLFATTNLQRFDNFETDFKQYRGLPLRVGIFQPIFAFNPWRWDKEILPLRQQEAELQYHSQAEAAAVQATNLFFNLLVAEENRRLAAFNKAANQQLLDIALERFELGKISRNDLVQIELELVSAQQNEQEAELAVLNASANIYQLLGLPFNNQPIRPQDPRIIELPAFSYDQLQALAQRLRPELIQARRLEMEAERDLAQARRDNGPRLDLLASFGLVRSDEMLAEVYRDPQQEHIVQLQLSVPILDGGTRRTATRRARAQLDYARELGAYNQQQLLTDLQMSLNSLEQAARSLELAENIRQLAEERFRISQESYLLGAIPLTDLSLAQRGRDQSNRAYVSGLRNYWLTYSQLRWLTGFDFQQQKPLSEL
ncbi:MAG: TolC family protein [Bacteroidota bacterium]